MAEEGCDLVRSMISDEFSDDFEDSGSDKLFGSVKMERWL
jgi:hypothetical protein